MIENSWFGQQFKMVSPACDLGKISTVQYSRTEMQQVQLCYEGSRSSKDAAWQEASPYKKKVKADIKLF